ncbi:winged helix-turn-helix transcriptional regulator [Anaerotignum sp.]|uniref:winged helix-turn-helix transcriptional regulator n=1 Tax=Anaerotignum sp. TaxID=2039241 RepID=UPI0027151E63|nr:helix-turn-helix domain-containing protein [Anaerotignum sp.]
MTSTPNEISKTSDNYFCPVRYTLGILGGKWKMPILCMLSKEDSMRYSSIKRKLGDVTNMMLAQSLKELDAAGIIHREQYNEIPPHVEYSLTEKGTSFIPVLGQFRAWGLEYMENETSCTKKCDKCQLTG